MGESLNLPPWPHRYQWVPGSGYVVWRDVFEGDMRCTLEGAIKAHRVAAFVCESEAENYCNYRNYMALKYGTDDVHVIKFLE